MSTRMRDALMSGLADLRHEPTAKRIRARVDGRTVLDTRRALLVWEPRRVVPAYAVPVADLVGCGVGSREGKHAEGSAADASPDGSDGASEDGEPMPDLSSRRVLTPAVAFAVHSTPGEPVDVTDLPGGSRPLAGFLPADPDLAGYVVLDFHAFEEWLEEDQPNVAHPRDPFHRVDVLPSSRHVRVELDGEVLADSTRALLLFETTLPTRCYLPREDVRVRLEPSELRSWCAYKGQASYWSPTVGGRVRPDLAWSYEQPLHEADQVRGRIAFFDERVDVVLDGEPVARPVTPWS